MPTEASATLAEGRYRLIEVIGSGGMATVYRAFDARLQVPRAIKVLLPALANRERLRQRFEAEARTMALLEHRNIVRVYDVGNEGNRVYIVMELVDGGSLVDRLEAHGALPPRQAVDVCLHVLAGLSVAHGRAIIHRDIKPHNVLLTGEGEVRVTDFGIARLAQSDDNLTKTGAVMGTWGFMAPEQRANSKGVDARADLYSVAATLYSCVTNETPMDLFAAELDSNMLARVPPPLAEVIRKATRYDRAERYADTAEMAAALAATREALPPVPPDAPALVVPPTWAAEPAPGPRPPPVLENPPAPAPAPEVAPGAQQPGARLTPTMIPDRTPPPPARDNLTFDALGADLDLARLEERAIAASKAGGAEANPPGLSGDAADLAAPERGRSGQARWWWAALALPLVVGAGWYALRERPVTPSEPPQPAPEAPVEPPPAPEVAPDATEPAPTPPPEPPPAPEPTAPAAKPGSRKPPRTPATAPPTAEAPPPVAPPPAAPPERAPPAATESPRMVHDPVRSASIGAALPFAASIAGGRYSVTLYYRPAASGAAYRAKVMVQRGITYETSLAVDESFSAGIEYHIKAVAEEPGLENLSSGSGFKPHRVSVH